MDKQPVDGDNVSMLPQLPPPTLITTPTQLKSLVSDLEQAGRLALDTESNSMYAYHYQVCLIQISTDEWDYIIDSLALRELEPLGALLQREDIEVTMHAAENDVLLLHKDFGWTFGNLFDTLWGARILGWPRPGLASILEEQFGVTLDKKMQRTDWGQRPLTDRQLAYARFDTHYLLPLRDRIERELRAAGRWQEAQEVFDELRNIRWQEKEPASFWRLNGARNLEPHQQAVLKALFEWREQRASQRNLPPYRIMRNEVLVELAHRLPTSENEFMRVPGVPRRFPPHLARKLAAIIRRAQRDKPPIHPVRQQTGQRPDEKTMARYEALRQWRTRTAAQRGVESDVVMTNNTLMAIARANPNSLDELAALGILGSWRLNTYGEALLRAMKK
jgi:ribonuclease D